ncbi:hypothetical protein HNR55_003430 [Acetobacter lovaniensis]|jgi:hypothetical protein|uniref:Uncharacterized protein n=1 Tax=Acetobacter lovaniensis TaxID=104100 RepID=A0A841QJN2_9PROT|nr:hypothetical protein [Acetobacter lovaniensis]
MELILQYKDFLKSVVMILTPCFISGLPKFADGTRFLEGITQVYGVRKLSILLIE